MNCDIAAHVSWRYEIQAVSVSAADDLNKKDKHSRHPAWLPLAPTGINNWKGRGDKDRKQRGPDLLGD